jgi:hypothetical protein
MGVRVRHSSKGERNGVRRLGDLGSCRGLDRVFHSSRRRTSDGPTARRRPRGCAWWCPRVARRRGIGRHVLQRRRLARSFRWCRHAAVDPEPAWQPLRPAPLAVDSVIGERHEGALARKTIILKSSCACPCRLHGCSPRPGNARSGLMPIVSRGSCTHDRVMTRSCDRRTPGERNASRPVTPTDHVHRDHRAALSRAARTRGAALTYPLKS